MSQSQSRPGGGTVSGLGTAPTLTPAPDEAPPPSETRADVPISVDDGIHPGLAVTAAGTAIDEPEERPDPWLGRVLSNVYRVESKIGEGGMGSVYLAKHLHLQKPYAIKVLSASIAKHAQAVERLKQEAIAASSIEHDNIVDVVNFDRDADGAVYIVMELLRGQSLHGRLGSGPMTPAEALPIAWQICAALGAAHARGIVHRDLKPENVFLAKRGDLERVKVLDFGISKVKSAEADGVRMTRTGQLVGTPLYMSPEQARGEQDIDLRVDVYALGVILYEMLAGAPPFEGRNYFELLWKHGNEPPPSLRTKAPSVSAALDAVVMRALAKDRGDRFQSMEALSLALEEACPEISRASISLPPEARRSREVTGRTEASTPGTSTPGTSTPAATVPAPSAGRGPLLGVAAVLAVVAAGGAWALWGGGSPPAPTVAPPPAVIDRVPDPPPEPPPEVPVAPDPPEMVSVSFGSTPTGVEVRRGDDVLCTTPCIHDLSPEGAVELTFHREGYLDQTRSVVPGESPLVEVRLVPRRRPTEGTVVPGLKTKI